MPTVSWPSRHSTKQGRAERPSTAHTRPARRTTRVRTGLCGAGRLSVAFGTAADCHQCGSAKLFSRPRTAQKGNLYFRHNCLMERHNNPLIGGVCANQRQAALSIREALGRPRRLRLPRWLGSSRWSRWSSWSGRPPRQGACKRRPTRRRTRAMDRRNVPQCTTIGRQGETVRHQSAGQSQVQQSAL